MEASALSSATSSLQQQYSLPRPVQETKQPRQSETTQSSTNTQQSSQTNEAAKASQDAQTQQQQQQPKPVVNAQGQKIGSIINESA